MIEVSRYTAKQREVWDQFAGASKQGTFLFSRNYMDYHADKFTDHSLIIRRKGQIYALLPANQVGDTLHSHQGLTYGGLLTNSKATVSELNEAFRVVNKYLFRQGIRHVVYKAIPWIYHQIPAEEDLYALTNVCNARLSVRHVSSAILLRNRMKFAESRRSGIRKALRKGVTVSESTDMAAFWTILNNNLEHKYSVHPVHTLAELQLLKARFPEAIRLFIAFNTTGTAIGGTLIYETQQVVHTQYISASPEGKASGALDLLFSYIIEKVYADRNGYLDFGKSSDGNGQTLNAPLIFQKEGFGGRAVCYDWYEWDIPLMAASL